MAELTKEEIEKLVEAHAVNRRLSPGQRWDVALILGALVLGATAVLGLGVGFVVHEAAKAAAKEFSMPELAQSLAGDADALQVLTGATVSIPRNAVMAFNEKECPKGWSEFKDAAGRVIVGVGAGAGLTARQFRELGGSEIHKLTADEMPAHRHDLWTSPQSGTSGVMSGAARSDRPVNSALRGAEGQGKPHNNMPPYIALYFCKKD